MGAMKPMLNYLQRLGPRRTIAWLLGVLLLAGATALVDWREAPIQTVRVPTPAATVELAILETSTAGPGAPDQVVSVLFAPDGLSLVSFNRDGAIRVWDADSGGLRNTFASKGFPLTAGAISPDGKNAVAGYQDGTVRWWNLASGEHAGTWKPGSLPIGSVALTLGGDIYVSGVEEPGQPTCSQLNVKGTVKLPDLQGRPFFAMAVAPQGNLLALAEQDSTISLWNLTAGSKVATLEENPESPISQLVFSRNGSKLLSQGGDGMVRVWDVASKTCHIATGPWGLRDMACSDDAARIATLDLAGEVRVWDSGARRLLLEQTGLPLSADCLALSPDGKKLVLGGSEGRLRFWDTATNKERARSHFSGFITSAALAPTGQYLAAQTFDGRAPRGVKLWNVSTGAELPFERFATAAPSFTADGTRLATADVRGTVVLWDVLKGCEIVRLSQDPKPWHFALATAITADGKLLATCEAKAIRFWDIVAQKEVPPAPISVSDPENVILALTPDGATLASLFNHKVLCLWNVHSSKLLMWLTPPGPIHSLTLTPDGSIIALGGDGGVLQLWDTTSGQLRSSLTGHDGAVRFVTFLQDGKILRSLSTDGTMKHWDVATGREQATTRMPAGKSMHESFLIGDDKTLISQEPAGVLRLWDISSLQP